MALYPEKDKNEICVIRAAPRMRNSDGFILHSSKFILSLAMLFVAAAYVAPSVNPVSSSTPGHSISNDSAGRGAHGDDHMQGCVEIMEEDIDYFPHRVEAHRRFPLTGA